MNGQDAQPSEKEITSEIERNKDYFKMIKKFCLVDNGENIDEEEEEGKILSSKKVGEEYMYLLKLSNQPENWVSLKDLKNQTDSLWEYENIIQKGKIQ
jgi:hypothetical protein